MTFPPALKHSVLNRGVAPDSFLEIGVNWAKTAPDEIFAMRPAPEGGTDPDVYAHLAPILGPFGDITHRKAAMLELMRVHAGFEASWNWKEGVDTTNQTSLHNLTGQETGVFQVSFDSTFLHGNYMQPFAAAHGIETPAKFIPAMKADHNLCLEYYARLVRVNTRWAGPILRGEIDRFLRRDAVEAFVGLLA